MSAHPITAELSTGIGHAHPSRHRILAAGDLNMINGENAGWLSLVNRELMVWARMEALELEFIGPQLPSAYIRSADCEFCRIERLMTRLDSPMPYDEAQEATDEYRFPLSELMESFLGRLKRARREAPGKSLTLRSLFRYQGDECKTNTWVT